MDNSYLNLQFHLNIFCHLSSAECITVMLGSGMNNFLKKKQKKILNVRFYVDPSFIRQKKS